MDADDLSDMRHHLFQLKQKALYIFAIRTTFAPDPSLMDALDKVIMVTLDLESEGATGSFAYSKISST
jgi:hypothetical protein